MAKGYKKHFKTGNETSRQFKIPAKARFMAFSQKYPGITNRIVSPVGVTPAFDPKDYPDGNIPFNVTDKKALWDTGATGSVLTTATVKELNLTPVGVTTVNHAGGSSQSNTYLVNFYLPNRVAIAGVLVTECDDIAGSFGAIIGMDIIAKGDFSITNVDKKTLVSFRVPSMRSIDYVEEHKRLTK
jgi:hypothetical protein